MTVQLNPYISFRDNAKQAMEFYQSVFGGELTSSTFEEFNAAEDEGDRNKIMHSSLTTTDGLVLMAADTPSGMDYTSGTDMAVSLSGDDEGRLRGYWDQLSAGGTVTMPYEKAPWGDVFGMCVDKFGVTWLINATPKE